MVLYYVLFNGFIWFLYGFILCFFRFYMVLYGSMTLFLFVCLFVCSFVCLFFNWNLKRGSDGWD